MLLAIQRVINICEKTRIIERHADICVHVSQAQDKCFLFGITSAVCISVVGVGVGVGVGVILFFLFPVNNLNKIVSPLFSAYFV